MHTFQNTKIRTLLAVILFEKKTLNRDDEHGKDRPLSNSTVSTLTQ